MPVIRFETPEGEQHIEAEGPVSFHEGFVECTRIEGTSRSAMIPRERVIIIEAQPE